MIAIVIAGAIVGACLCVVAGFALGVVVGMAAQNN